MQDICDGQSDVFGGQKDMFDGLCCVFGGVDQVMGAWEDGERPVKDVLDERQRRSGQR